MIMKCNKNNDIIQKALQEIYQTYPRVHNIIQEITQAGGKAYFVGGAVRDILLQRPIKDLDIEIHGLSIEQVASLLCLFGTVNYVGKAYGVFKIMDLPVDWSLPRKDSSGRKPQVTIDPAISIKDALVRRDLTMNAMAIDTQSEVLIDPFNGSDDIARNILRVPDTDFFDQDPLRFYRVMQFISRFQMYPDDALQTICRSMDISKVSRDRICQEFTKMLLQSKRPSLGIRWLHTINRLHDILPELANTVTIAQDPRWHPEGNVFEHSMQALDAAAAMHYADDDEKLCILYAALCHDLGKVSTTFQDAKGIHSYGHAQAGQKYARTMLNRIVVNKKLIKKVTGLVRWHMYVYDMPDSKQEQKTYFFVKRLAYYLSLYNVNIALFAYLVLADRRARNASSHEPLITPIPQVDRLLEFAHKLGVAYDKETPLLTGTDFMTVCPEGPAIGHAVAYAYRMQLKKQYDKETLKKLVIKQLFSSKKHS